MTNEQAFTRLLEFCKKYEIKFNIIYSKSGWCITLEIIKIININLSLFNENKLYVAHVPLTSIDDSFCGCVDNAIYQASEALGVE